MKRGIEAKKAWGESCPGSSDRGKVLTGREVCASSFLESQRLYKGLADSPAEKPMLVAQVKGQSGSIPTVRNRSSTIIRGAP
mmetsp:Transcript_17036/g.29528  ORF Transcript_17036/g.29528 Transcript_17036/m.29528 type:complete len:82 (+) Transcript_17036:70-315(+)